MYWKGSHWKFNLFLSLSYFEPCSYGSNQELFWIFAKMPIFKQLNDTLLIQLEKCLTPLWKDLDLNFQGKNIFFNFMHPYGYFQKEISLAFVYIFQCYLADLNHVILKMILWPKLESSHSEGTMGQAFLPVSTVTKGSNPLLLLPKQVEGLGPWCYKTGCPLIAAMGSF